jgi:hypothetical protein
MKKKLFIIFYLSNFFFFKANAKSVFPEWFSRETAKIETLKEFIRQMEKEPDTYYKIELLSGARGTDEVGHESLIVNILFITPECVRGAIQEWKSYHCNNGVCKPLPFNLSPCQIYL